jgi:nucleoside-diphosphate-sugar epimerase
VKSNGGDPKDDTMPKALEQYAGRTILVTGGAGFIGSSLIRALAGVPCRIRLLLREGRVWEPESNNTAEVSAVYGDIREKDTWTQALQDTDYVFHLAGQTSGYLANEQPMADLEANVIPVIQLLEACRHSGAKPAILFSGTVTQVGIPKRLPVDESHRDLPVMVYDIHKLAAEKYLQYYSNDFEIPAVTLRLSNVYGPGTGVGSSDRGILNRMIFLGLQDKPLTVYGDGAQIRDYTYIDDVVSAFVTAGSMASTLKGEYYVIGSGQGFRIVDTFNLMADRVKVSQGFRPQVTHVSPPDSQAAIENRDFVADTHLFRSATGWTPQVSLSDGIDRTIEFFLAQREPSAAGSFGEGQTR